MDIQRYLADEPVLAGPSSATYRMKKYVRRNRPQVIAASIVFVALLLLGFSGTIFGFVRAEKQRLIAEAKEREAVLAADEERQAKDREAAQRAIPVEQRTKAETRDRTLDERHQSLRLRRRADRRIQDRRPKRHAHRRRTQRQP